ncbi:hypothetical protein [Biostraticola tofi]|uniref:Uncharacterized protein n=1 Tax=Biostraticola tofi TaxID=466109 RepID=A0A4R3YYR7_9GAMM|nr:hypothetical protein [Biostraticola tofi]TCV96654.1 hypothetical protein EDC52_10494 [Biostraticola tofi]
MVVAAMVVVVVIAVVGAVVIAAVGAVVIAAVGAVVIAAVGAVVIAAVGAVARAAIPNPFSYDPQFPAGIIPASLGASIMPAIHLNNRIHVYDCRKALL